jgi:hypothetical protein
MSVGLKEFFLTLHGWKWVTTVTIQALLSSCSWPCYLLNCMGCVDAVIGRRKVLSVKSSVYKNQPITKYLPISVKLAVGVVIRLPAASSEESWLDFW